MERQELINKYNLGQGLSAGEKALLEQYLEQGDISIEDLNDLSELKASVNQMMAPVPSEQMSAGFYQQLTAAKRKPEKRAGWFASLWNAQLVLRWAYSIGLVVIGLGAGLLLRSPKEEGKLERLSAEVSEMKEMMMLTLLEKDSPSDRLKAVNLTSELPDASVKVTEALLKTLNNDPNVNVRLATLEALYPYASHPEVREGLIRSIARQQSPLVQMALGEMMVVLQEKGSVENLQKILKDQNTPPEVKERIQKSIEVLI
ncbi:hypothetical protein C900_00392 [Fulvivirga imtechensis AK7]|uniref:HEAT repeat domain-containing protein n=1 Tax=Fulvivirga imtechensis AK7 TaxID=1237149 RepID=L8JLN3_9BACT|nr:HEAT repeat domain-containing protein [Fulvivirga imtechensis]ELR68424.1 hypothetical protein C900_00392 [Fulvivirga imtechensis AK7]